MTHPPLPPLDPDLGIQPLRRGKVRDVYQVRLKDGRPAIMLVATDRLSAFDVVLPDPIPGRGIILTQITRFWLHKIEAELKHAPDHHLLSTDPSDVDGLTPDAVEQLKGRVTLGRPCHTIPIECVARGYLAGSGWKSYQHDRTVCGVTLPAGLQLGDQLPQPIFTPATKAESGHDENISFDQAASIVGSDRAAWMRDTTLRIYEHARDHAADRGLLLADTKFEFGIPLDDHGQPIDNTAPILIDEVATPDSSRYWPADGHQPGREPDSFDKQIIRNALQAIVDRGDWNKTHPGPSLPAEILQRTADQYREVYQRLTGQPAPA
ncbi:phosphoribosylaminoimidazolesuccinocarboxamide synthase [Mucisphaera calidilacus]|uniref:Phosphoribosylaminoimidazole-succinocarboxamide synthase n=1 Tax=Mucisphaera calidilacus TaxID=2527982 RepID=A0A518BZZ1_9BACT|nr:phosphoribosylaminoimidazolesuccinocarboxamide synthase [Mucisphaera calidilacus]QDU72542.1 Phosphoribosylaminoimidazole-succinocarboxamide synthase [Mucisphaera calidilacus]